MPESPTRDRDQPMSSPVSELRLVLTVHDHARAVAFYRDELGLEELDAYEERGGHLRTDDQCHG